MARFLRSVAPAAALGGLAIVIVGVADPVFAGRDDGPAVDAVAATASGAGTTAGEAPSTSAPEAPSTTPSTTPSDAPASGAADPTTSAETVTGPGVQTPWGPVQVAATVSDGQVLEVHAIAWPSDRRSQQINAYAIPLIDEQASQVGVEFDSVSGATYTSEAYRESLQALLDSL
jgi:uncharacterized protein with FMN-binding domain